VYVSYPGHAVSVVCPAATVNAPPERVWSVLADSTAFSAWTDAELVRAVPPGPAAAGQRIDLRARALGRWWPIRINVLEAVPPSRLVVDVRLPFGTVNHETIQIVPEGENRSLVRFN
jgi:uncharacterized protein YndB with AHSA1/START domain